MDPFAILEVSPKADDQAIREAYLKKLPFHSPDRDPEGFQLLRKAYEMVSDEDARLGLRLFWNSPPRTLEQLAVDFPSGPEPVGPEPWLALIAQCKVKGEKS